MRLSRIFIVAMMALSGFSGCMVGASSSVSGKFERSLNVSGPVDLDVATGSGVIDIRAGSPGTVRILGVIKASNDSHARAEEKVRYVEANPPIETSGNTIRVGHIKNPDYRNNVSISYEIQVPPETKLAASTGSGSVRVDGLRRAVDASTGSGSIAIANIEGDVSAKTGSGGIELHSLRYVVVVTRERCMALPADRTTQHGTYRCIGPAVEPDVPSKSTIGPTNRVKTRKSRGKRGD